MIKKKSIQLKSKKNKYLFEQCLSGAERKYGGGREKRNSLLGFLLPLFIFMFSFGQTQDLDDVLTNGNSSTLSASLGGVTLQPSTNLGSTNSIKWAGGSKLYDQPGTHARFIAQSNSDRFDIINENASAYIASFNGPGSFWPNRIKLYHGVLIGSGSSYAGYGVPPTNGLIVEGNVGIGKPNPTEKLEVDGNINLTAGNNFMVNGVPITGNQTLALGGANGNELSISGGNSVILPLSSSTLDEKTNFSARPFPSDTGNTIATEYPSLTNADVQTLTGNGSATTANSAGWFYLQEVFHAGRANFWETYKLKRYQVPSGETYIIDQPLILDIGGTEINFAGSKLTAKTGYDDYVVKIVSQWGFGNYQNLHIDGNYTAKGLWVDYDYEDQVDNLQTANHWELNNLQIERCTIGLNLSDTYYGAITGHSVIGNSLIGINMYDGHPNGWYGNGNSPAEVNTLNLRGLDLNGPSSNDLVNFGVDPTHETKAISNGVTTLNVQFRGITMENWHTALYLTDEVTPTKKPKIVMEGCYFEAISNHIIDHAYTKAGSAVEMVFSNNHVNFGSNNTIPLVLPIGSYKIENNNFTNRALDYLIDANNSINWKNTVIITDVQPYHIKDSGVAPGRLIVKHSMAFDAEARDRFRVENYVPIGAGVGNNPPAREVLSQWSVDQDKITAIYPYQIADAPTQNVEFQSATNTSLRDISFTEDGTGIILKDQATGAFRRLILDNGQLKLQEENRKGHVYNFERSMNINYFLNLEAPSTQSEKWYSKDFHYSLMKWSGTNWVQTVSGTGDIVCIGTTSQRPTTRPSGFVYYDTDLNNFYTWTGVWTLTNDPTNDIIISNL